MGFSKDWLCEASALALSGALERGEVTSVEILEALLERINEIDVPGTAISLRSVLAVAPDALDAARQADAERARGLVRSPLHGVPILIKDNIEAVGLPGTAGSTALLGRPVPGDSPLVTRLRDAGLVVFGSTNLSQWANMRSPRSTSGWSAVAGLVSNPFQLDRSAGGSSSGSGAALAARLTPLAVGTETDGSITCPASLNGVTGLKAAVGTIPAEGIVPISASQDSPGPMARTVLDTAALYAVLADADGVLDRVSLGAHGAHVAVAKNLTTGDPGTDSLFTDVVARARHLGFVADDVTVALADGSVDHDELTVLVSEMADDLTAFLSRRGGDGPSSLAEVITHENDHADIEMPYFGHEFFDQAVASGGRAGTHYRAARTRNVAWAVEQCLEPALSHADCFIAPCYSPAWKHDLVLGGSGSARWSQVTQAAAIAGWPIATVPMGLVQGLPVGLSIVGRPGSEVTLLAVAFEFEKMLGLVDDGTLVPKFLPPTRG
ncbi:MAG TPA: amidase family protein [Acidimicrobiales bacterium]|nr:amidase family protein [Acidimicrobiales bacterium]